MPSGTRPDLLIQFSRNFLLLPIRKNQELMTGPNDLVLIYLENQPVFFARIENIVPDRKPGWVRMNFLILQVPVSLGEWILLPEYIQGEEFTMGGKKVRIEKVEIPREDPEPLPPKSDGKIVSLSDRRRKI
jgi:hypothetical protein